MPGFPVVIVTGVPAVSMCEETSVTSAARLRAVLREPPPAAGGRHEPD